MSHDWETVPAGEAATRYTHLVLNRVTDGMPRPDWEIDWENAPLEHAYYQDTETHRYPLPDRSSPLLSGTLDLTPATIADMLHFSYGILSQRLALNLNDRRLDKVFKQASGAKWGRATASGGGRYCCDFYLITSSEDLGPGIYHYSILEHGWELVRRGDATGEVARIQNYDDVRTSYLVTTIDYWRSGFKYNDFAYQASSMDTGTVAGTMLEILGPDLAGSWDYWVDEEALATLLGLDRYRVGVYSVQQFGPTVSASTNTERVLGPAATRVNSASEIDQVVFSTTRALQDDMARTEPAAVVSRPVSAVETTGRDSDWLEVILGRETSFGRFTGQPIDAAGLRAMLERGFVAADRVGAGQDIELCYLVYVSRVTGLEPGLYRWDRRGSMVQLSKENQDDFVSGTYFLNNYDPGRVAATVILCANTLALARRGVRSYRYINFVVGAMCQALSLEAVRHNIGTGTALGFDPHIHSEHAGLDPQAVNPMLMIMVGADDDRCGRYHSTTTRVSHS